MAAGKWTQLYLNDDKKKNKWEWEEWKSPFEKSSNSRSRERIWKYEWGNLKSFLKAFDLSDAVPVPFTCIVSSVNKSESLAAYMHLYLCLRAQEIVIPKRVPYQQLIRGSMTMAVRSGLFSQKA